MGRKNTNNLICSILKDSIILIITPLFLFVLHNLNGTLLTYFVVLFYPCDSVKPKDTPIKKKEYHNIKLAQLCH